jgi:ATP-dependent DNA helicase DinG
MPASHPPSTGLRFRPEAAARLRAAIAEAGGIEVFAIGAVDGDGRIREAEVHARGNAHAVTALFGRVKPGQVVIHNHPSGVLQASDADLALAAVYAEQGVGVVIVDNEVQRDLWVVEPPSRRERPVDLGELERFFADRLPASVPGWEHRVGQLELAQAVAARLNEGGALVAEAGTGTGKSLAYLLPAVLWATTNDDRVVISTFTRALQDQLAGSDIPQIKAAGLQFEWAIVKGRANYLCRRRLQDALEEGVEADAPVEGADASELRQLTQIRAWAAVQTEGTREDLGFPVSAEAWESVASDRHQCLGARCPTFDTCAYFQARRKAAASHLIIVNHSLLLADLAIKREAGGLGVLPAYARVVLDEAHHVEDAATTAGSTRLTAIATLRALAPLLPRSRRRRGALDRIRARWGGLLSDLDESARLRLEETCDRAVVLAEELRGECGPALEHIAWCAGLADHAVSLEPPPPGVAAPVMTQAEPGEPAPWMEPLSLLVERISALARTLGALEKQLQDVKTDPEDAQPLLDLRQARLRLAAQAEAGRAALEAHPDYCRWLEPEGRARRPALCRAPIDVAPFLAQTLYATCATLVFTSATLRVGNSFGFTLQRLGLDPPPEGGPVVYPIAQASPFDYASQVLLGLPRDLPPPDHPEYEHAALGVVVQALTLAQGGAFVLCTSFEQVRALAAGTEAALGARMAILRQGEDSRWRLLERFREDRDSVLIGTDSFWEGVSVKGDALRLVIIPRLPFGVPTEPITMARHARLRSAGVDPFRADSLPRAVLKLRQGFGRLVRAHGDRGVVMILDRRLHDRWYGRQFLASLPPATRAVGPTRAVMAHVARFYQGGQVPG